MFSNGTGSSVTEREEWLDGNWLSKDLEERSYRNGKHFIQCICPKCTNQHTSVPSLAVETDSESTSPS